MKPSLQSREWSGYGRRRRGLNRPGLRFVLILAALLLVAAFFAYGLQTWQTASAQERTEADVRTDAEAGVSEEPSSNDSSISGDSSALTSGLFDSVRLEVPLIMQRPELPTGCEATATAMLLQYAGSTLTKLDVAGQMPYSDDPYEGFVGNPYTESGFTIYPRALLPLVRTQLGSAVDLSGASLDEVRAYLQDGKPVACWIADDRGYVHCVVVIGYEDDVLFLNDPLEGATTMTGSEFEHLWSNNARRALSY